MGSFESWQPLSLDDLKSLFAKSEKPYWVSGGWAIDLFLGRQTRPHDDLDISIARSDLGYFQQLLIGWDLQIEDPPSSKKLRPLMDHEVLESPYYNIWSRKDSGGPWNLQIMICDFGSGEWIYRRNRAIRGPIAEFGWRSKDGLDILSPVIQLLYKSRSPRDKDLQDLDICLQVFDQQQRDRLVELITLDSGETHPWLAILI
jgi:hypothetical protein